MTSPNQPKSKANELSELVADEERKQESVLSAWSGIGDENPDGLKRAKEAANGAGLAVASWATNRSNLRALLAEIEEKDTFFRDHAKHVDAVVSELYAIMVDPLEDGALKREDVLSAIFEAAKKGRDDADEIEELQITVQVVQESRAEWRATALKKAAEIAELRAVIRRVREITPWDEHFAQESPATYSRDGYNMCLKEVLAALTPKPLDYIESTTVGVDTAGTTRYAQDSTGETKPLDDKKEGPQ